MENAGRPKVESQRRAWFSLKPRPLTPGQERSSLAPEHLRCEWMKFRETRGPDDSSKPTGQSLSGRVQRSQSCDLIGFWLAGRWGEAYGAEENLGVLRQAELHWSCPALPGFLVLTPDLGCSNGGVRSGLWGCFGMFLGYLEMRALKCLQS